MYLKLFSAEDHIPEDDSRRCFRMISDVVDCLFVRDEGQALVQYTLRTGETYQLPLTGSAMLLDEFERECLDHFSPRDYVSEGETDGNIVKLQRSKGGEATATEG